MNPYDKAISLIKIRPHFSAELAKKLALRGFKREEIEEVINRLTEERLLNDELFLSMFLENMIKYKSFGFYGLKAKLMQRGVSASEAESLLIANFPPSMELEIAKRIVEKVGDLDKNKLVQKLARKGFRTDVIRRVINKE